MSDPKDLKNFDMLRALRDIDKRMGQTEVAERPRTNYGTSNPASWPTGLPFYRTDLGWWIYYDGSQWLTVDEYPATLGLFDATTITFAVATVGARLAIIRSDYKPYFTTGYAIPNIGATNNNANYWTFNFVTNAGATIWSFNTSLDAAGSNPPKSTNTFTQPAGAITFVQLNLVITAGAPTGIIPRFPTLYYRLVVP